VDELHRRGKAMEDLFFQAKDKMLLEDLKAKLAAKDALESLATVSGIEDQSALDALIKIGVTPASLASVSLIPLVAVAWADGKMNPKEREAILSAADGAGIDADSPAYALLDSWLNKQPDPDLFSSWKVYIKGLKNELDETTFAQIKLSVLERATYVAESAGGFLGLGNKISESEKEIIEEMSNSF
jgi:hypothetical protein